MRDFYRAVAGWGSNPVDMGGHQDFNMLASDGSCVAGICHARGANAVLPAQWLIYVVVENVDESAARCAELGGRVRVAPRAMGRGRFCVIEDPAGTVCALYRP